MIPVILVSNNSRKIDARIEEFKLSMDIPKYLLLIYQPLKEELISIDDTRIIRELVVSKKLNGGLIHIPNFNTATKEAQQSILKILEDYGNSITLILSSNSLSTFIPTILSRCRVEYINKNTKEIIKEKTIGIKSSREDVLSQLNRDLINERAELLKDKDFKTKKTIKNLLRKAININNYNINHIFEYFSNRS